MNETMYEKSKQIGQTFTAEEAASPNNIGLPSESCMEIIKIVFFFKNSNKEILRGNRIGQTAASKTLKNLNLVWQMVVNF